MKKTIAILMATILFISIAMSAVSAEAGASVFAENISLENEATFVPVMISDNPGIMGFKITVKYPSDLVEITNVTVGGVTAKGNFIHNCGKVDSQIDIIWFSSEQSVENGTLFALTAKAKPLLKEKESTTIILSYSQEDTFNEKYEDVELDCRSFSISYGQNEITDNNPSETENKNVTSTVEYSDSQIISAVDAAIADSDIESIDQMTFDNIISNLNTISGANSSGISTIDELKQRYREAVKNEYVKAVQTNIEPQIIAGSINNSLEQYGANSISDLTSEEAKSAIDEINKLDKDLTDISKSISDNDMIDILNELLNEADAKGDPNRSSDSPWIIVIICSAIVFVGGVLALIVIVLRKRRLNEKGLNKEV